MKNCYYLLGTLGDDSGAPTCSQYIANSRARRVRSYPSFEDAVAALKADAVPRVLVPAAYPKVAAFIQDADLCCENVFLERIPPLVLAGASSVPPDSAQIIFYHPATTSILPEVRIAFEQAVPTMSNPEAARLSSQTVTSITITNLLAAQFYRLTVYHVLRAGVLMPWLIFTRVAARRAA